MTTLAPELLDAVSLRIPYCPHDPSGNDKQHLALIAWRFLPDAYAEPVEIGYGGAAGGGKSDWILMGALEHMDVPGYAAIIFRRTFSELALPGALMARARQWLHGTDAKWTEQEPPKTWTFPSGATLTFAYLATDGDCDRYQSAEFQFVGFDEATHFTEHQYTYLFSRLRRLEDANVPLRMYSATNPGGVGHAWYKRRFVAQPPSHDERELHLRRRRVFVPARLSDNPHIDQRAYKASLDHLGDALRDQLLLGDWDAFEGMAFPEFNRELHVINWPLTIPAEWARFESMDHGKNHPTAWYAYAVDHDGTVVVFDGYYRPGNVSDHAPAILRLRAEGRDGRQPWWQQDEDGKPVFAQCFADPTIRNTFGVTDPKGREMNVQLEYSDRGIVLAAGQNNPRAGYLRVSEMLRPDPARLFPDWHPSRGLSGSPRLFVLQGEGTKELVEQLGTAPVKAEGKDMFEVIDPVWESEHGHSTAALRYGLMSRPAPSRQPEPEELEPRRREAERMRMGGHMPGQRELTYVA